MNIELTTTETLDLKDPSLTKNEFFALVEQRMPFAQKMVRPLFDDFDVALINDADLANESHSSDTMMGTFVLLSRIAQDPGSLLLFAAVYLVESWDVFVAWSMFLYTQYEECRRYDARALEYLSQPFDIDKDLELDDKAGAMRFFDKIPMALVGSYTAFMADFDIRVAHLVFTVARMLKDALRTNVAYIGVIRSLSASEPGTVDRETLMLVWPLIRDFAIEEFDQMPAEYWSSKRARVAE